MDLWYTEESTEAGVRYGLKVMKTLYSEQSAFQKVDVVETAAFGKMLLLDGLVMTTDRDEFIYHEMISHVPLLALPEPARRALVIGGGDGGTVREILKHPSIDEVVLCEIDQLVIDACKQWMPQIAGEIDNPKVRLEVRDGVAFVANEPDSSYDLVIIDSTDPLGPGVGLFTEDFYRQVARILKPQGIMTAQTESPFSQELGLTRIYENLHRVFPVVAGYWGVIPTYPGSLWTWGYCSKQTQPLAHFNAELARQIERTTRYYNVALQQSCFALPSMVRQRVKPSADLSALEPSPAKAGSAC